jgi:hypothetical protein
MEIIRDQMWQFVGVVVSVLAIAITIAIYFLQKNKKELTLIILSQSPLLNAKSDEIKVFHNNINIDSIYITEIKVINSGRAPILPADYIEKVGLFFNENNLIISAELTKADPETINVSFEIEGNKVLMNSVLLNPKDSINFRLLTKLSQNEFKITGRVVGIREIKKQVIEKYINSENFTIVFSMGLGTLLFGLIYLLVNFLFGAQVIEIIYVAILSGLAMMLIAKWYAKFTTK